MKIFDAERKSLKKAINDAYNHPSYSENRALKEQVKNLTSDNEALNNINKALRQTIEETKAKFTDIFEGDLAPKGIREKIFERLRKTINEGDYGYDIANPPVTGKKGPASSLPVEGEIPLPTHVGTTNRAGMLDLHIPEIGTDGKFNLGLPDGVNAIFTPSKVCP